MRARGTGREVSAGSGGRPAPARVRWVALAGFVAASAAAGLVGSLLQGPAGEVAARYGELERPAWAPPGWAFGIVWPVLYVLIGLAAWRVWRVAGGFGAARLALGLWALQLAVNALWPGLFFGLDEYGWAAALIALLVVLVVATAAAFRRHDRLAAWLLAPYLLWILYATALNVAIWRLN